jgi:hypothetical protein
MSPIDTMMHRAALLSVLLLSACAPDATGNWKGSCWMDLSPAVYSDPSTDLGPHEWVLTLELVQEDDELTGDFDFEASFDGSSGNGDIEGSRSEADLTMTLSYIDGNDRGRFELEAEHDEDALPSDIAWYNDKDNMLQADGECDLEYRF